MAVQFKTLLVDRRFIDALPGHLPPDEASQARLPDLLVNIYQISEVSDT